MNTLPTAKSTEDVLLSLYSYAYLSGDKQKVPLRNFMFVYNLSNFLTSTAFVDAKDFANRYCIPACTVFR